MTMTQQYTAEARLDAAQLRALEDVQASFAMEGMDLSAAERDVLARYVLDEIDAAECRRQLDALDD